MTTLIVNAQIFPKSNHYYTLYSQALRSILALQWLVFRRDGSIIISVGHVFFLPLSWVWHVPCNALSGWQNAQCALKIEKKIAIKTLFQVFCPIFGICDDFSKIICQTVTTKKPKSIFSVRHVHFALFSNFITHCVLYTKSSSAVEASRDQAGCK